MTVSNGSIVGSWYIASPSGATAQIVFTFLADGTFLVAGRGTESGSSSTTGLEWGSYTWNAATGAISLSAVINTDGDGGLSHAHADTATVVDDVLTFTAPDGPFSIPRLMSPPDSIVGSWYADHPGGGTDQIVFTFLADGTFLVADKGTVANDPNGTSGIEWGNYTWNPTTGATTINLVINTDGEWGMGTGAPQTISATLGVSGDTLSLAFGDGATTATRLSPLAATTITGTAGNDSLTGTAGNDTIAALAGIDTVAYAGARSGYTVSKTATGFSVAGSGTDTLTGVERLQFTDTKLALDLDGNAGKVSRILGAVFGRESVTNKEYVGIGLSYLDGGMSYEALMALAIDVRLGGVSATAVVNLLWGNVIGGTPSAADLATYSGMLQGDTSAGALGVLAANTSFNEANIGLVGLMQTGIEFV